jgi:hypothetical protein
MPVKYAHMPKDHLILYARAYRNLNTRINKRANHEQTRGFMTTYYPHFKKRLSRETIGRCKHVENFIERHTRRVRFLKGKLLQATL